MELTNLEKLRLVAAHRQELREAVHKVRKDRLLKSGRVNLYDKRDTTIPPLHTTGCNVILNDTASRRFGQRCGKVAGEDGLCGIHRRYAHR